MAARFYVYALKDGEKTVYVGKGSGRRLDQQRTSLGLSGDVLEWFSSEAKALAAERKWIAELRPSLNKCAGGNGGRVRRRSVLPAWHRNIERIGTRRYAALLVLACHRAGMAVSNLEQIRQVAHGRRV